MCGDNGFVRRLSRIQLLTISALSTAGIIALAYGWSQQSDPGILAILLLLYGVLLPLVVIVFTFMKEVGIKQRVTILGFCLLMSITALSLAVFGEKIVDSVGVDMVSYLFWPGREINFGLSAASIVLCEGITLWQHLHRQS